MHINSVSNRLADLCIYYMNKVILPPAACRMMRGDAGDSITRTTLWVRRAEQREVGRW